MLRIKAHRDRTTDCKRIKNIKKFVLILSHIQIAVSLQIKNERMNLRNILWVILGIIVVGSCENKKQGDDFGIVEYHENVPGDSTLYGLACDGCTDSVIVILPYSGGDPDTFDIICCERNGKLYGQPRIGHRLAVTVNPNKKKEAEQVIVLDDLEQQWCFAINPVITEELPDSVMKSLMIPHEYSYMLKRDNQVRTIGTIYKTGIAEEQSPAVYPDVKQYNKWVLYNGKLILAFDMENAISVGNDSLHTDKVTADTADIVMLAADTLVLRMKDGLHSFYKK